MSHIEESLVRQALSRVEDPEIGRPITELDMVKSVEVTGNDVAVVIYLTIAGCPMKSTITENVRAAIEELDGVGEVSVSTDVMSDEQRRNLRLRLRGSQDDPVIPFSQPDSTTRVFAVASGKGGVGKSSMTVNLAAALAARGLSVGILDADIYGHSIPHMLGSTEAPNMVEDMIMPPQAHGIKHISIAHFTEGNAPVVWRGPMLHRAITQFLTDVFWGDIDVLLVDLPPGTGDVAISISQLLPTAELLIVTTPQAAAAEVAERAGTIAQQTRQRVRGVIENMGAMVLPDGSTMDIFGSGGGATVASRLTELLGTQVPLLGSVPLDPALREQGDTGIPIAVHDPSSPSGAAVTAIAEQLVRREGSLTGVQLGVNPRR
ncbi:MULTISPECIES: Mrp/NBP35 family ATP-binding protein [unclassified Corynebacterium]|uniref:Mrp/NBP35 family ATP-binding protein n=1 Tax=unclassified Corynebacterium TaxID=2624378 RepID=UPI001C489E41|nr:MULTISPECIES: Mrp/NBP35 family ATP-binding protein [unclassified Corynebacterium]MBV7281562.1 Mrp/NBP35 family ATP-binding protein [Corynebacterium sp. TAE3-ERU30]MBV7301202.1 Mrp/NBP35 family ATP-binding protein [Corynebacterium sp. TAE3-ERU2]